MDGKADFRLKRNRENAQLAKERLEQDKLEAERKVALLQAELAAFDAQKDLDTLKIKVGEVDGQEPEFSSHSNQSTAHIEFATKKGPGSKGHRPPQTWPHNGYIVHRHRIVDGKFVFYVREKKQGATKTTIRTGIEEKGDISLNQAIEYVKAKIDERANQDGLVPIGFSQAYANFVETLPSDRDIKEETINQYKMDGNVYARFFGEKTHVHRIKDLDIRRFLKKISEKSLRKNPVGQDGKPLSGHWSSLRGCKPRTKNKHIRNLKLFFGFAQKNNYCKTNPADGIGFIRIQKAKQLKRDALSYDEARRLLEKAREGYEINLGGRGREAVKNRGPREYLFRFCLIGLHTGLRESNIRKMFWSWVDFATATITIPAESFKTGIEHKIPIHHELLEEMKEWKEKDKGGAADLVIGSKFKSLLKAYKWLCERAEISNDKPNITKLCPHVLRHTANSWIAKAHGQAYAMALLGHSPKSVSDIYTHVALEDLRDKVSQLPALLIS